MPDPIVFTFTDQDRSMAIAEARRRAGINEASDRRGRNGGPESGQSALVAHLIGAAGELAVASYLGMMGSLYADLEPRRGSCDLPGIDVKTRSRHRYDLVVQSDDEPGKLYVLVTIEKRLTLLHGWIEGSYAMRPMFYADPARGRPAYFVPKHHLRPMPELRTLITCSL